MYLGEDGTVTRISPRDARSLIAQLGSVRKAAAMLQIPRSTLHDLATNTGKRPSHVPLRGRR